MANVFVSYARTDRERVADLIAALNEKGWTTWWDTSLTAGQRFDTEIETALRDAKAVIAVWTPDSVNSQWVKDEAGEGAAKHKLIPVIMAGARPPLGFRQYQTVDLSGWTGHRDDPRLEDLFFGLRSLVEKGVIPKEWQPRRIRRPWSWYARGIGAGTGALASAILIAYAFFPATIDPWLPWNRGFKIYPGFSIQDTGGEVLTGKSFQQCRAECEARLESCKAFSYLASSSACFSSLRTWRLRRMNGYA